LIAGEPSEMAIKFDCPKCGRTIRVRDDAAGRAGVCPGCNSKVKVPASVLLAQERVDPPARRTQQTTHRRHSPIVVVGWGMVGVVAVGAIIVVAYSLYAGWNKPETVTSETPPSQSQSQNIQRNIEPRHSKGELQIRQPKNESAKQVSGRSKVINDGDYYVETQRNGDLTVVQVTFRKLPSSTDAASRIVRQAIEDAVAKDGSREILAMAFNADGDALSDEKYGGALSYKPNDKSIKTMDERRGVRVTTGGTADYFLKVEEDKTLAGIVPEHKWLTCQLVFATSPSGDKFKEAASAEIAKLKDRQLDITLYAFVGDKSNPTTWLQVKADNGKYMKMDYKTASGSVTTNW